MSNRKIDREARMSGMHPSEEDVGRGGGGSGECQNVTHQLEGAQLRVVQLHSCTVHCSTLVHYTVYTMYIQEKHCNER